MKLINPGKGSSQDSRKTLDQKLPHPEKEDSSMHFLKLQVNHYTRQNSLQALKRVAKSLPSSPRKRRFVVAKMAQGIGL